MVPKAGCANFGAIHLRGPAGTLNKVSADKCQEECDEISGCVGFSIGREGTDLGGLCYLYKGACVPDANTAFNSYIRVDGPAPDYTLRGNGKKVWSGTLHDSLLGDRPHTILLKVRFPPEDQQKKLSVLKCTGYRVVVPDYGHCKASSVLHNNKLGSGYGSGGLSSRRAWTPRSNKRGEWWQMDVRSVEPIVGIRTQGKYGGRNNQRVTSYTILTSLDGKIWHKVQKGNQFPANTDRSDVAVTVKFVKPIRARYVRIVVETWSGAIAMRAAVLVGTGATGKPQTILRLGGESEGAETWTWIPHGSTDGSTDVTFGTYAGGLFYVKLQASVTEMNKHRMDRVHNELYHKLHGIVESELSLQMFKADSRTVVLKALLHAPHRDIKNIARRFVSDWQGGRVRSLAHARTISVGLEPLYRESKDGEVTAHKIVKQTGTEQYISAVWNGKSYAVYPNKAQREAVQENVHMDFKIPANAKVMFGGATEGADAFSGIVYEARVFKRALSSSEIQASVLKAIKEEKQRESLARAAIFDVLDMLHVHPNKYRSKSVIEAAEMLESKRRDWNTLKLPKGSLFDSLLHVTDKIAAGNDDAINEVAEIAEVEGVVNKQPLGLNNGGKPLGGGFQPPVLLQQGQACQLSGDMVPTGPIVTFLPEHCRPMNRLVFHTIGTFRDGTKPVRVDMYPDGKLKIITKDTSLQSLSLEGILISTKHTQHLGLSNGWEHISGYQTAGVVCDAGFCTLQGSVNSDKWKHIITRLPKMCNGQRCRPARTLNLATMVDGQQVAIQVKSSGLVRWVSGGPKKGLLSLSGINFVAHEGTELPTVNGWKSITGHVAAIAKNGKQCFLTGMVSNGPSNSVVMKLPAACKPSKRLSYSVKNGPHMVGIDVLKDGTVRPVTQKIGGKQYSISLDGIIIPTKSSIILPRPHRSKILESKKIKKSLQDMEAGDYPITINGKTLELYMKDGWVRVMHKVNGKFAVNAGKEFINLLFQEDENTLMQYKINGRTYAVYTHHLTRRFRSLRNYH
jgi:ribosomal protein L25 (general stress protein Ctc)